MRRFLALTVLLGSMPVAAAHVTLKTGQAKAGSTYDAVFRIGHGCAGAPTTAVRVRIPEGVVAVEPLPKAGWTLGTTKGAYAREYDDRGTPVREGVTEVAWKDGSLPDGTRGEFAMRVFLTADLATKDRLFFPVVQECPGGRAERWIEIPAAGRSADDYEAPAPGVTIRPGG